jgi:hypothetical protein
VTQVDDDAKYQHLQTERRFDLANGPHAPLVVTMYTDSRGITGFKITDGNESLMLWRTAFDALAQIAHDFEGRR